MDWRGIAAQVTALQSAGEPGAAPVLQQAVRTKTEPTNPISDQGDGVTMVSEAVNKRLAKMRRPPWQLMMTSTSDKEIPPFSAATIRDLTRIFELFPNLSHLTVQTREGDVRVTRDFSGNYPTAVDGMLENIFRHDSAITGIIFPGTGELPDHLATRENPHWSPAGKTLAEVEAAYQAGEITADEARDRMSEAHIRG